MRQYLRLLVCLSVISTLLFTACRNEPKIPNEPIKNEVVARLSGDPENLNFILASDGNAIEIFKYLSVPMASFDPGTYSLTPTMIKSMPTITEITEGEFKGRMSFDFEILEEATWDNGTPITANDLLFTYKTVFNPNYASPHRSLAAFIKKIEIDEQNPKKFRIIGAKYIIAEAVVSNFELMPKYIYDPEGLLDNFTFEELTDRANAEKLAKDETLKAFAEKFQSALHLNNPEGIRYAGPYQVEKWTTGQEIVLTKKKNWWGDKMADKYPLLKANPDKITYKIVKDINAAISLAKNGEIDVINKIPWTSYVNLKADKSITDKFNLHNPQKIAYRHIVLNMNSPKLEDKRVRQALDHLFNRDQVFETVYYGAKNPVIGPVHPTKTYYNKNLSVRSFNVDKAKELLNSAGWTDTDGNGIVDKVVDGEKIEMNLEFIYGSGYADFASIGAIFKESAIKAGVNLTPKTIESQAYFKTLKAKEFEMVVLGNDWYPLHKDPKNTFGTTGGQNYSSFSNAEADEIINKLRYTMDESQLPEGYLRLQEIIHEEVPSIFINSGTDRIITSKKFTNVRVTAVKPHYYLNEFAVNQGVPVTNSNN